MFVWGTLLAFLSWLKMALGVNEQLVLGDDLKYGIQCLTAKVWHYRCCLWRPGNSGPWAPVHQVRELDALDSWRITVADKSLWGLVSRPLVQPLWCRGVFVGVSEEVREVGTTRISVARSPVRLPLHGFSPEPKWTGVSEPEGTCRIVIIGHISRQWLTLCYFKIIHALSPWILLPMRAGQSPGRWLFYTNF